MPLKKKKKEDIGLKLPGDGRNIEKSLSSPDIGPTGNSEDETKKLALKRSESQRLKKTSWFKRLTKPFRRFRRNTSGCFPTENRSNSEFHTSLSSEIVFDNLNNGINEIDESNSQKDEIYEVVRSDEIKRNDVKRKSSKKSAPPIPFNANVIQELKKSLDQTKVSDPNNSSPTSVPDHPIYGNEADLRHITSTRRQSSNFNKEKRLSDLGAIYEDTWNIMPLNTNTDISSTNSHIQKPLTITTSNSNQIDELDFMKTSETQPIETLYSKFPKPKLPKRNPSRRGSKPDEYLKDNFEEVKKNRKESNTNRKSNAELDELIQKLTEIQPPKIEDLPDLPPTPKKRTIFDSLPNLSFEEKIKSMSTVTEDNKPDTSNKESVNLTVEGNMESRDKFKKKADQLINEMSINHEFTDSNSFNIDTLRPNLPEKPYLSLTRNNSYPRSKTKTLVYPSSQAIMSINGGNIQDEHKKTDETQKNTETNESVHLKRSLTLPTHYSRTAEVTSKSTTKKLVSVKREVRSTSESNEYVESENIILSQDNFTQTSMTNLLPTNIESILESDFKNFESQLKELLADTSFCKNIDNKSTPPNTPEQLETNEGGLNSISNDNSQVSCELQSVCDIVNNKRENMTGTTIMTKHFNNELADKKIPAETINSVHNDFKMSSKLSKSCCTQEVFTSLSDTSTIHQQMSDITLKTGEMSQVPTKIKMNGSELLSKSACSQTLSQKPSLKIKPPITPKPQMSIQKQDDFVRRGAVRRKSNSTSDDHSTLP